RCAERATGLAFVVGLAVAGTQPAARVGSTNFAWKRGITKRLLTDQCDRRVSSSHDSGQAWYNPPGWSGFVRANAGDVWRQNLAANAVHCRRFGSGAMWPMQSTPHPSAAQRLYLSQSMREQILV